MASYFVKIRVLVILTILSFTILGLVVFQIGNEALFLLINRTITPGFGQLARLFSAFGETAPMLILILFYLFKSFRFSLTLAFSWLLGSCFSWAFKYGFAKNALRPEKFFLNLNQPIETVSGVEVHHYHSFPSGHTLTAFTLVLVLPFFFRRVHFGTAIVFWVMAFGCGLSRIVLAQHWPVDVLGGIFFGCLTAIISVWASFLISGFKWSNWKLKFWGIEREGF